MIGAGLEDLGKGLRSQVGTLYGTLAKGPRYLEMAEGYIKTIALDKNDEICGYEFVHLASSWMRSRKALTQTSFEESNWYLRTLHSRTRCS